jgi:hypothetical protein
MTRRASDPVVVELIVGSDRPPIQAMLPSRSRGDAGQVVDEHVHVVAMLLPGASSRSLSKLLEGDPAGRTVVNPKVVLHRLILLVNPRQPPRRAAWPVPRRWSR